MLVQILKCVCPDGFDRTLAPGEVVALDDDLGARYIAAEYAAPVVVENEDS